MNDVQPQVVYKSAPISTFMIALLIGAAFIIGTLYSKVQTLETQAQGGTNAAPVAANNNNAQPQVAGATAPTVAPEIKVDPVTEKDHIRGKLDAPVILVEYSDTDCPFCAQFHPTMQRVKSEYGDKVSWVYRHFPLTALHPGAQTEAIATECVAKLGGEEAFWKYLDQIVLSNYTATQLADTAAQQGINKANFESCMSDPEAKNKVLSQAATGQQAGVNGTPATIMVTKDGAQMLSGALPYEQVKAAIDAAL